MKKTFAIAAIVLAHSAQASNYGGTLQEVRTGASPTTNGNIRVSIHTGSTTDCSGLPGWYSFDLPDSGLASLWQAILLESIATGKQVIIFGAGTGAGTGCDSSGLEIVAGMSALPQ